MSVNFLIANRHYCRQRLGLLFRDYENFCVSEFCVSEFCGYKSSRYGPVGLESFGGATFFNVRVAAVCPWVFYESLSSRSAEGADACTAFDGSNVSSEAGAQW